MGKVKKAGSVRGNLPLKIFMHFLLVIAFLAGLWSGTLALILAEEGVYTKDYQEMLEDTFYARASEDLRMIRHLDQEETEDIWIINYCDMRGVSVEIFRYGSVIFSYPGDEDGGQDDSEDDSWVYILGDDEVVRSVTSSQSPVLSQDKRAYRLAVDSESLADLSYDGYGELYRRIGVAYEWRYALCAIAAAGVLLFLLSFIYLMCAAGHKKGEEGIRPGLLGEIPLDVHTVFWGGIALLGGGLLVDFSYESEVFFVIAGSLLAAAEVLWCTLYCEELAVRLKLGGWWRNTLVYRVLRLLGKLVRGIARGIGVVVKGIPMVLTTVILFLGIMILEFAGVLMFVEVEGVLLWLVEKILLFFAVVYTAVLCSRLQAGSEALAEGRLTEKLDTKGMFGAIKAHGENLNRIGQGMGKAVEERMKSEHLKTELITNVSHDLKTPLTSIINYADLIEGELKNPTGEGKAEEYAQVLLRQSNRLKRLLEDLVEASKATTGNIEVNLAPCEIEVILEQAVGEYEQRFREKGLELLVRQPQGPLRIMADGRHLWRVFDNLLGNIYKYALESTRVYLTVEKRQEQAVITFRNMSKYALDMPGEELEERFVRGDKSRHEEGSGLGLSIAKSLVELQNGRMEIVTDGDLFKVILAFGLLP